MKELSEQQKEKLSRILAKGKWNYVLMYGVLCWGLLAALFARIFGILWHYKEAPFGEQFISEKTLIAFIVFPIMGIGWGFAMWKVMQKTARKRGLLK